MCCCLRKRRNTVGPAEFSGGLTGGYRTETIAPNRKISIYYVPSKLQEVNQLPQPVEPLLHRTQSEPSMIWNSSRPPSTAKSMDTQFTTDCRSSDEELPSIDHKLSKIITVNVEIEQRPKTGDSLTDVQSLPPLPLSPLEKLDREGSHRVVENILGSLEDVSKTVSKTKLKRQKFQKNLSEVLIQKNSKNLDSSSSTTAFARLKRVTWNLSSRFRSAEPESKQDSNKDEKNEKENRENIEIIEITQPSPEKVISEPSSPRLANTLQSRAKSARTTFGEYRMIQKTLNDFAKTAIFFIHGVGGCAEIWKSQIHYFSERGFEVIAINLIGHGRSSKPRIMSQYHFNTIKHDILILFDRYAKQRNVIVAHSYGSVNAVA